MNVNVHFYIVASAEHRARMANNYWLGVVASDERRQPKRIDILAPSGHLEFVSPYIVGRVRAAGVGRMVAVLGEEPRGAVR